MNDRMYYSREAEARAQRQFFVTAVFVAALSVGIGAVIAMFFAPRPGSELREDAAHLGREAADRGRELAERAAEEAQRSLRKAQQSVEDRLR